MFSGYYQRGENNGNADIYIHMHIHVYTHILTFIEMKFWGYAEYQNVSISTYICVDMWTTDSVSSANCQGNPFFLKLCFLPGRSNLLHYFENTWWIMWVVLEKSYAVHQLDGNIQPTQIKFTQSFICFCSSWTNITEIELVLP